jgi:undecaprenyl-diphosphatase
MSAQIVADPELAANPDDHPSPDRHRGLSSAAAIVVAGYAATVFTLVLVGLLLTHVLLDGPVGRWDTSSTRWLAEHRTGALDGVMALASRSADTFGIIAVALVVLIVLWARRRFQHMALLVTGLTLELSAFLAVNALVGRDRPDVLRMGSTPSTSSFPSGHTAATLVLYAAIAFFVSEAGRAFVWRVLAWTAAAMMPVVVGFARVYRGFHHPTDVAFGYALGCAVLLVAALAVRTWSPKQNEEALR